MKNGAPPYSPIRNGIRWILPRPMASSVSVNTKVVRARHG